MAWFFSFCHILFLPSCRFHLRIHPLSPQGFGRAEQPRGPGRRRLQYKDWAADGGLCPVLCRKPAAPQLPPSWETGIEHPGGFGTGRNGNGAGYGYERWFGLMGRKESSARQPDFPTVRMGENEQRNTEWQEMGEGLSPSAPFNKQTGVLRAVARAHTPRPIPKHCKITERLLIFSIFAKAPSPGVMRMQRDVSFQLK